MVSIVTVFASILTVLGSIYAIDALFLPFGNVNVCKKSALHFRLRSPLHLSNVHNDARAYRASSEVRLFATTNNAHPIPIILLESELQEKFVRSTGNGGQKVNKSSSKVDLVHIPTGLRVSCQEARDLSTNRKRARSLMLAKLDLHFNGKHSKVEQKRGLVRKRKSNASRKARKKYGSAAESEPVASLGDQDPPSSSPGTEGEETQA